jgi:cyclophilin family peptidyl-prolyl cis-trans isomerase
MANSGPDTNSSQFFITFNKCEWLNQKHTVFGRVIQGFEICQKAKAVKTGAQDKPLVPIRIAGCGELKGDEKLSAG